MGGMTGRVDDAEAIDPLAPGEGGDVLLRHGHDLTPEPVHVVAVEPRGALEQLRRPDQVRRA